MKRLLPLVMLLAIAGQLMPMGVRQAHACTCTELNAQQAVDYANAILIGDMVSWSKTPSKVVREGDSSYQYGERNEATIRVDRYLKGRGPSTVKVVGGVCIGVFSSESVGTKYLLFLRFDPREDHGLATDGCDGSGPASVTAGPNCLGPETSTQEGCIGPTTRPHRLLAEVEQITGRSELPDDSLSLPPKTGSFPVLPATALAIFGPLAFLAGAAFVWRRRN